MDNLYTIFHMAFAAIIFSVAMGLLYGSFMAYEKIYTESLKTESFRSPVEIIGEE